MPLHPAAARPPPRAAAPQLRRPALSAVVRAQGGASHHVRSRRLRRVTRAASGDGGDGDKLAAGKGKGDAKLGAASSTMNSFLDRTVLAPERKAGGVTAAEQNGSPPEQRNGGEAEAQVGAEAEAGDRASKAARVAEMEARLEATAGQVVDQGAKLAAAVREDKEKAPGRRRWAKMKGSSVGEHLVVEPVSCSTRLKEYLALPVEEYSLLDPTWINKDTGEPNVFHFKVPLSDLVGLKLEPQLWVAVDVEPERERVRFSSSRFKFGDTDLDFVLEEVLRFEFTGQLAFRPERRYKNLGDLRRAGNVTKVGRPDAVEDVVDVQVAREELPAAGAGDDAGEDRQPAPLPASGGNGGGGPTSSAAPGGGSALPGGSPKPADPSKDWDGSTVVQVHKLKLEVSTRVELKLPAGAIPGTGLMISSAGKLVLKAAQQALATAFVRLVAEDYRQWTAKPEGGERDSTGSLLTTTTTTDVVAEAAPDSPK